MNKDNCLVFADGSIEDASAGYASGVLWLYFRGMTIQQASRIAFNETKTREITYIHGATKDVFTGFVYPYAIINADYEIKVQMRGENTTVQIAIPRESEVVNDGK